MTRYYKPGEVISIKTKKLDAKAIAEIHYYLDYPGTPKNKYINALYDVILSQLIIKAGYDIRIYPNGLDSTERQRLELLAERLTRHHLKRKLNRIKQPEQLKFKEGSEILDPHHHLNSVYVKDNTHLLDLLPDFGAIYVALRGGSGIIVNDKREHELCNQQGILTDTQFLGRSPKGGLHAQGSQRLNPTVGYVRGPHADTQFKEGFISQFASKYNDICRCCDMCGPETKDSWQDLERYLNHTIRHKAEIIRVHIGETHIPEHGKRNVEQLFRLLDQKRSYGEIVNQIIRLGHGTHMGFQSMKECVKHGYYVEACLSSNKETGIITKRSEYPLGPMLLLDVKVMIGTDGGDLYYTDLKKEYAYAKKNIDHFLEAISKGGSEVVQLPNGDKLRYQHVKHLFKDIPQAQGWDDTKEIQFADLKLIEDQCKQKINMQQLVENMNEFKGKMFPGHSNKAALVDEQSKVTVLQTPDKVDLAGVRLLTGPSERRTTQGNPCLEVSCPNKNQADYIASMLVGRKRQVYEVVKINDFWRVKAEKTLDAAEAVSELIDSSKPAHAPTETPKIVDLIGVQLFMQNRYSQTGACFEFSCKTQKQAEYIKEKLTEQNISVHTVELDRGYWRVKFDNSFQAKEAAMVIIGQSHCDKTQLSKHSIHEVKMQKDPISQLINVLDNYKKDREAFKGSSLEYKTTYFGIGFGFSKTQKFAAVEALKNALNGQQNDLTPHLAALQNGQLGKSIREFLDKTDSIGGNKIKTISDLIDHLSRSPNIQNNF